MRFIENIVQAHKNINKEWSVMPTAGSRNKMNLNIYNYLVWADASRNQSFFF